VVVTSGFSETGDEGRVLENKLVSLCKEEGIVLVGPNTMGFSVPLKPFCHRSSHRPRQGSDSDYSQSGNLGIQLITGQSSKGLSVRVCRSVRGYGDLLGLP